MKTSQYVMRYRVLLLVLLALVVSAGCVPVRMGVSWPVMDTIMMNGETRLMVAYNHVVTLIEPSNGALTRLENAEGEVRYDEQNNPRTWSVDGHQYENAQFFARPVPLDEETLLFPAYNNRLLEVDLLTATVSSTAGIPLSGPTIAEAVLTDKMLYVPLKEGDVVALDRETYDQKWKADTDAGVWTTPLLVDNTLYVASIDHHLYAFDAETGASLWKNPVDLQGLASAAPLYYDGFLYIGSYSHTVFKISVNGEIVDQFDANNWIWSTPVVDDGMLYVTDLSGYVYAIDPEDMTALWSVKAGTKGIRPAPLVTEAYVIVASRDGVVYWLSRSTGEVVNRREIEGRPEILSDMLLLEPSDSLKISETLIVVSTVDPAHLVYAFPLDYKSGYQGWAYRR